MRKERGSADVENNSSEELLSLHQNNKNHRRGSSSSSFSRGSTASRTTFYYYAPRRRRCSWPFFVLVVSWWVLCYYCDLVSAITARPAFVAASFFSSGEVEQEKIARQQRQRQTTTTLTIAYQKTSCNNNEEEEAAAADLLDRQSPPHEVRSSSSFPELKQQQKLIGSTSQDDIQYGIYSSSGSSSSRTDRNNEKRSSRFFSWLLPRWFRGGGGARRSQALASTVVAPNHTSTIMDNDDVEAATNNTSSTQNEISSSLYQDDEQQQQNAHTASTPSSSVHLQLTDPNLGNNKKKKNETPAPPEKQSNNNNNNNARGSGTTIKIHTYRDPTTNKTWKALNTAKRKFRAYLQYNGVVLKATTKNNSPDDSIQTVETTSSSPNSFTTLCQLREEWRKLWKQRQLLTDRTELLAVYPSDEQRQQQESDGSQQQMKRGGFADLLSLYTERIVAVFRDEQEHAEDNNLVAWLASQYGPEATDQLQYRNFVRLPEQEQLTKLKHFLEWFRSEFPYFYDKCGSCGASIKEDDAAAAAAAVGNNNNNNDLNGEEANGSEDDEEDDDDMEHRTFVGYIYPDEVELQGKASRTELYQCHVCDAFTRFPRFNSAWHVMEHRRGRCGEYSMLLFRFLRALQHETRWVVDWADHVWAEVLLTPNNNNKSKKRRWVHLDPCEAAVDENHIYQEWGKKQTFILGFYLPPVPPLNGSGIINGQASVETTYPMIEDITQSYTSESWSDIFKRREESEEQVRSSIENATKDLKSKLLQQHDNDDDDNAKSSTYNNNKNTR